nr:hypothetical protein [Tanacetum cinerariifolium]
MHLIKNDLVLGILKFVPKAKLKKARKWKQPISAPKKESSLTVDDNIISNDHEKLVTKKSTGKRKLTVIVIKDTVDVSKKKTSVQAQKHKGVGSKPEVPDEPKGKSIHTSEEFVSKLEVSNVSKAIIESDNDKSIDLNKTDDEEETQEDEFVHAPDDYIPTDDETRDVDDEEYDHINEEMYDDMNVELKDADLIDEGKGDEEMFDAEKVNAEHKEANQEKEKTDAPPSSSCQSVSSSYGSIFLNLDNISSVETEIISMLDVQVQHENPIPKSKTLFAIYLKVSNLEKEVKELINVNHSITLLAIIKSEVLTAVKEYLGTNLGDALQNVLQRYTKELIQEHSIPADVIEVLKQQQKP